MATRDQARRQGVTGFGLSAMNTMYLTFCLISLCETAGDACPIGIQGIDPLLHEAQLLVGEHTVVDRQEALSPEAGDLLPGKHYGFLFLAASVSPPGPWPGRRRHLGAPDLCIGRCRGAGERPPPSE